MRREWLLLGVLVAVWGAPAAEARPVTQEAQWWHLATATGRLEGPWLYYLEAQPRVGQQDSRLLLRSAIGYELLPSLSVWLGYGWIPVAAYEGEPTLRVNEGRLYQQLLYTGGFDALKVVNRFRLEERLLASAPSSTAWRARNLLRGAYGLGAQRRWSLVVWDELFVHLNTVAGGPQTGFDQNRAFAGVGFKATDRLTVEVGYLNVVTRRPTEATHLMFHVLSTTTNFSFL